MESEEGRWHVIPTDDDDDGGDTEIMMMTTHLVLWNRFKVTKSSSAALVSFLAVKKLHEPRCRDFNAIKGAGLRNLINIGQELGRNQT